VQRRSCSPAADLLPPVAVKVICSRHTAALHWGFPGRAHLASPLSKRRPWGESSARQELRKSDALRLVLWLPDSLMQRNHLFLSLCSWGLGLPSEVLFIYMGIQKVRCRF